MNNKTIPIPTSRALKKLGEDLKNARKRRRITTKLAAERANISRTTLTKIEKGDAGVSMGAYAKVLFILGLISHLADMVDIRFDKLGMTLETEHLPKRVRHRNRS
ncbi:MAG: helix-turn-helix domain-containing protein [Verrucomicrobiota bacterium]|nr:helix-turn-helix domain-containing protein [Verrucomicrobiota bacterium]